MTLTPQHSTLNPQPPAKPRLLIVDDDEAIRSQMKWALAQDYEVVQAEDRQVAVKVFKDVSPSATLLDLGLPPHPNDPEEGLAALSEMLAHDSHAKIIIASGQADKKNALAAVAAGAYDFLNKPVEIEELKLVLRRCLYLADLERENREMQQTLRAEIFEEMIGSSPQMQAVFAFIRKVAATAAPVLLLGESGTGKEMAALAVHRRSPRKNGPFIPINCSAIPENLLESELFGHEKGSFTGAHQQRSGLIESAAGGTLFLDEIGDLPSQIQVKLLRFLQDKRFQRVGGRSELKSDARIVAATNANLHEKIAAGTFREDLYFRLAVVVIQLPPLRGREDDAVIVAREFLHRFAVENARSGLSFAPDTLRAIRSYTWPGNLRELQNRVQRAVIMADSKKISVEDLELPRNENNPPETLKEARERVERELILQSLRRHNGKITGAATELGISRPTLYELMEKLSISKDGSPTEP